MFTPTLIKYTFVLKKYTHVLENLTKIRFCNLPLEKPAKITRKYVYSAYNQVYSSQQEVYSEFCKAY